MPTPTTLLPVKSGAVQLTLSTTAAMLATLIAAVDAAISNRCAELVIQADPSNGAAVVYIGDASLSASRMGTALVAGDSITYRNGQGLNALSTLGRYLLASTGTPKVNVDVITS